MSAAAVNAQSAIPRAYERVANEYRIPASLFYAVALQESQATLGRNVRRPWPWTLNVAGVGYRYGSQHAAYHALGRWLARGENRIDVGLMQVHWRYHSGRLGTAWTALQPYHNLRVGASILRDCFRRERDWIAASGCYHSSTPARATRYAASVAALRARQ